MEKSISATHQAVNRMFKIVLLVYVIVGTNLVHSKEAITLADPTILYVDSTYFLYGTEPPPQSGFLAFSSPDLENWMQVKNNTHGQYILDNRLTTFGTDRFWAPQVIKQSGNFVLAYSANEQIAVAKSTRPQGPFVQNRPEAIAKNMRQIDPFIFIDSDEKAYLYHVRFDRGNHIYVAELESDLTTIKSNTLTHVISALPKTWEKTNTLPRANVVEGPTVIKQKGLYYLLYSANHFKSQDYAVGFATATSPLGPWVRGDDSPILHYKATALKGSGHGDAFVDANGDWQYVFHAHSSDQSVHPRKTYIVPFKFIPKPDAPDTITMEIDKLRPLYVNRTANQQSGVNSK